MPSVYNSPSSLKNPYRIFTSPSNLVSFFPNYHRHQEAIVGWRPMPRGLPAVPAAGDQEEALMMTKTNAATPCAACRLLRRRCAQECPFSPYFSPSEPLKFAYVHKVFGASNVAKMLMVTMNPKMLLMQSSSRLTVLPVYWCVLLTVLRLFFFLSFPGGARESKSRHCNQSRVRSDCEAQGPRVRMRWRNLDFTAPGAIPGSRAQRSSGGNAQIQA